MMRLRPHDVTLRGEQVTLRPMTEADWETLLKWNSDPEVLYFSEEADVDAYTLAGIQGIYRSVSQDGFCFMIEIDGQPIGECWLQRMNLSRILTRYPEDDCRRIDLMIGEKSCWGHGYGSETIRLLTRFAFVQEQADRVFGCEVADYNPASRRAFEKAGYRVVAEIVQSPGSKAKVCYDLQITSLQEEPNDP